MAAKKATPKYGSKKCHVCGRLVCTKEGKAVNHVCDLLLEATQIGINAIEAIYADHESSPDDDPNYRRLLEILGKCNKGIKG